MLGIWTGVEWFACFVRGRITCHFLIPEIILHYLYSIAFLALH